jgi:prepilin-type N-terminal cleavage/methylation domain-containing protein
MPTSVKIQALRKPQRPRPAFTVPHPRERFAFTWPELRGRDAFTLKQRGRFAFTLLELLVVMAIIAILMALIAPAFTSMKRAGDITSAAYAIKGVLDQARTYAMANNTYTWIGFYEENGSNPSPNSATPKIGRIVMSVVASKDGTMMYTAPLTSLVTLAPANLIQVGKLAKIDNVHLKTFPAPTAIPPPDTFDTRPAVASAAAQIGDTAPPNPSLTFHYPVGSSSPQYTFVKVVQFSPRGEGVIDNSNYTLTPVSEIGVQASHGTALAVTVDPVTGKYLGNLIAVQLTGIGGNVKIYRR